MTANVLPKSLHTVTVLVQFGRALAAANKITDAHAAIALAARVMFDGEPPADAYGLKMTAARKLAAEFKRGSLS